MNVVADSDDDDDPWGEELPRSDAQIKTPRFMKEPEAAAEPEPEPETPAVDEPAAPEPAANQKGKIKVTRAPMPSKGVVKINKISDAKGKNTALSPKEPKTKTPSPKAAEPLDDTPSPSKKKKKESSVTSLFGKRASKEKPKEAPKPAEDEDDIWG